MDSRKNDKKPSRKERPKFKIPLNDEWSLIFLSSGRRFVYNSKENRSTWDPPVHIEQIIKEIDKDQMILLIAKARGLRIGDNNNKNTKDGVVEEEESVKEPVEPVEEPIRSDPLEEEHQDHQEEDEAQEEDDNSDSDNSEHSFTKEIYSFDESEEEKEISEEDKKRQFFELLDEYHVNPFGIWETELNKIIEDDRYDIYDTGNQRIEIFNLWAKMKIGKTEDQNQDDDEIDSNEDPIISFLLFIKKNYKSKMFYIDFKRKFRKDSLFSNNELSDKDKEKLYREYSVLMKKPEESRIELLKEKAANVKDIELEPIYYTIDNEKAVEIIEKAGKTNEISTKKQKLLQRKQTVDAERRKLDSELHRSRIKLNNKAHSLSRATYEIDSMSSLRNILRENEG